MARYLVRKNLSDGDSFIVPYSRKSAVRDSKQVFHKLTSVRKYINKYLIGKKHSKNASHVL